MSNEWIALVVGALLATVSGVLGERLRMWLENRQELKFIKVSLSDELTEIIEIISKFKETYDKTAQVHKTYLNDLSANMESFSNHRSRIFLFRKTESRKSITTFYKRLRDLISDTEGKVGTLANTAESKAEQKDIVNKFIELKSEASSLKKELD